MKLNSVQALRALAAGGVVIGHLRSIEGKHSSESPLLSELLVNGASGVDLFFVISGFIMVWVAGDNVQGARSAGRFLFSRATRIYPLWWLFAGAMAIYFWATYGLPWDAVNLDKYQIDGTTHLLKSFALMPQEVFPLLGVGWTLVHEMYFYLGFALLLFLSPGWRITGLAIWGGAVIVGSVIGLSDKFAGTWLELAFFPMTFEFIMGAFVAITIKAGWSKYGWLTATLGAISFVVVFVLFDFKTGGILFSRFTFTDANAFMLGWGRTLFFGIPAAFLLHGLVSLELTKGWGKYIPRPLVWVGDWSYALYLCHVLVLSAVARLYFPIFSAPGQTDSIVFMGIGGLASILVAGLTYHFYEGPLLAWFRPLRNRLFKGTPSTENTV